jgi:hypothetical protein
MKITLSTKKNKKLLFTILSGFVVLIGGCAGAGDTKSSLQEESSIEAAETAWMQMNLKLSRKNLENVWAYAGSSAEDKAKAAQMLAIQDWKFFREYDAALARIKQAIALGVNQSVTWQALSRIARENGAYSEARDAAIKAIEAAKSESQKRDSQILLAHGIHDQAINSLSHDKEPGRDLLNEAHHILTGVLTEEPGHPAASKLLLGISLLRRDGPTALNAWRYFFFIPANQTPAGLLNEPGKVLNRILPKWRGQTLSPKERETLVLALAQSRFFEYALVAASNLTAKDDYKIKHHPDIQEVVLYADFIKSLKNTTDEYYRQIAINKSSRKISRLEKSYRNSLWREAELFWNQLPFTGKRPRFEQQSFISEISNRFGTEMRLGAGGNYSGLVLFMGHSIVDDTVEVEQYGRKAKFRLIVLESMVSNGYSGWFWDGRSAPGGWGTESTIVQIREVFLDEPFKSWRMITDTKKRSETEKLISQETARDDALARAKPYAFLPGLKRRLQFDAAQRIYASMKAKGHEGAELCIAFVAEYLRLKAEASVEAHEGRHAIDQLFYPDEFRQWTDEREFRAKLSQIVFTSDPKFTIATGGIMHRNIGSNNYHGKANERIMKTIIEWMGKHTAEIPGIDTTRPLLPQFDLLSSGQIKAIFIAADPMAPNAGSP